VLIHYPLLCSCSFVAVVVVVACCPHVTVQEAAAASAEILLPAAVSEPSPPPQTVMVGRKRNLTVQPHSQASFFEGESSLGTRPMVSLCLQILDHHLDILSVGIKQNRLFCAAIVY